MDGGLGGDPTHGHHGAMAFNGSGDGGATTGGEGVGGTGGGNVVAGRYPTMGGNTVEIRNVWAHNLEAEMATIRELMEEYPYVAMDTEFPGVVARPLTDFNQTDYQYQTLRCNVDMLKIIQLGLSFANEKGQLPEGCCCWQFNFKFSLSEDMYAQDSIDLLTKSGIDFGAHESMGVDVHMFAELLMTSGLVLLPNVRWISFHSGYDFGYLVKLLTCEALPQQESEFFELLSVYFPKVYDIKYLVYTIQGFHGGLNKLAEDMGVERIGPMHQAGSDSLLTAQVFLKVVDMSLNGLDKMDHSKYLGQLYGYGGNKTVFRPGRDREKQQHGGDRRDSAASVATANGIAGAGNGNGNGTGGFTGAGDGASAMDAATAPAEEEEVAY